MQGCNFQKQKGTRMSWGSSTVKTHQKLTERHEEAKRAHGHAQNRWHGSSCEEGGNVEHRPIATKGNAQVHRLCQVASIVCMQVNIAMGRKNIS